MYCIRCGKKKTNFDQICNKCKTELISKYDHAIDWETAFQIEKELKAGEDIVIDF